MFNANVRSFVALTTLLAGLLAVPGCDAGDPAAASLAAYTPNYEGAEDPVAGMSLKLAGSAAIELADGEVVELALSDEQRATLECDGDARVSQILIDPLQLGDRGFVAPVLEATCDGESPTAHVNLREAGESCDGEDCIAFIPALGGADLPLSAPEGLPASLCLPAGTQACIGCGLGRVRTRILTSSTFDPSTGNCSYGYTYGTCDYDMCTM
ncbi:hypothetical protein OV090_10980 [Nannocystis sp. RBIL2]|uniref:hypothetical protein n=1 Tax=Nannocystis sp. RBIL2 TaxID=2996788 RepID=UPI00226E996E|nr:hypothetical protein [Nannocystis sp. RBIL2]MCY1065288.1 hypothetical protein [Nannocystis sp. RBIL2]